MPADRLDTSIRDAMNKKELSERDICTKFITPAIEAANWLQSQFREEVNLTKGRIIVRGKIATRVQNPEVVDGPQRADYVFYALQNLAIAVLEAKRNIYEVGHGMQQALRYAEMLDVPIAISSNGDGFLIHDRSGITQPVEREVSLEEFPTHDQLWTIYQQWKGLSSPQELELLGQPYHVSSSDREAHYYQKAAINRAIEAIAKGQQRAKSLRQQSGLAIDAFYQQLKTEIAPPVEAEMKVLEEA